MNREDYEKYHKKGGFYEIPVEVFNSLLDEQEAFIKWLEEKVNDYKPSYKCVWQSEKGNRCEQVNDSKTIMKSSYVIYQEVLDKFRGVIDD